MTIWQAQAEMLALFRFENLRASSMFLENAPLWSFSKTLKSRKEVEENQLATCQSVLWAQYAPPGIQ